MSQYRRAGQIINGSNAYSWNVTTSALRTDSTIRYTITDDVLLFSNIATTYRADTEQMIPEKSSNCISIIQKKP